MMVSTAAAADVVAQFNGIVDCATNNNNNNNNNGGGMANKDVMFESNGNGMLYGKSGCLTVISSTANHAATESGSTTPVPPSISVVLTIRLLMQGKVAF